MYFIFIYVFCLQLCIMYVSGVHGGQRRVLDPLELELWTVVTHYVGTENWTQVLWRTSSAVATEPPLASALFFHSCSLFVWGSSHLFLLLSSFYHEGLLCVCTNVPQCACEGQFAPSTLYVHPETELRSQVYMQAFLVTEVSHWLSHWGISLALGFFQTGSHVASVHELLYPVFTSWIPDYSIHQHAWLCGARVWVQGFVC